MSQRRSSPRRAARATARCGCRAIRLWRCGSSRRVLVDRLELFVMPVTLGGGTERIDASALPGFGLDGEQSFGNGW